MVNISGVNMDRVVSATQLITPTGGLLRRHTLYNEYGEPDTSILLPVPTVAAPYIPGKALAFADLAQDLDAILNGNQPTTPIGSYPATNLQDAEIEGALRRARTSLEMGVQGLAPLEPRQAADRLKKAMDYVKSGAWISECPVEGGRITQVCSQSEARQMAIGAMGAIIRAVCEANPDLDAVQLLSGRFQDRPHNTTGHTRNALGPISNCLDRD
jgi:hypothetical protein